MEQGLAWGSLCPKPAVAGEGEGGKSGWVEPDSLPSFSGFSEAFQPQN